MAWMEAGIKGMPRYINVIAVSLMRKRLCDDDGDDDDDDSYLRPAGCQ